MTPRRVTRSSNRVIAASTVTCGISYSGFTCWSSELAFSRGVVSVKIVSSILGACLWCCSWVKHEIWVLARQTVSFCRSIASCSLPNTRFSIVTWQSAKNYIHVIVRNSTRSNFGPVNINAGHWRIQVCANVVTRTIVISARWAQRRTICSWISIRSRQVSLGPRCTCSIFLTVILLIDLVTISRYSRLWIYPAPIVGPTLAPIAGFKIITHVTHPWGHDDNVRYEPVPAVTHLNPRIVTRVCEIGRWIPVC